MFTLKCDEGPLFTFLNCYNVQSGYFSQEAVADVNHVHRAFNFDIRRIRRVNRSNGSHYYRIRCPHPIRFRTDWVEELFEGPFVDGPIDIMHFFAGSPASPSDANADVSTPPDDISDAVDDITAGLRRASTSDS